MIKTQNFNKMREEYGSFFAFHGSGVENWHSIFRRGLANCSGTKLQTSGAAYGSGVYLALDSGTSMGFAKSGTFWSKSTIAGTGQLKCLAICEVVKHPYIKPPNPYYVIDKPEYIAVRFFLFYNDNSYHTIQINSLDLHKFIGGAGKKGKKEEENKQ